MENARNARRASRYDRRLMSAPPPPPVDLDAALRTYLRHVNPNQKELAKYLGRSQGWLNKYINGAGRVSLNDAIRLAAIVLLGVAPAPPLWAEERKLVRDFRSLSPRLRAQVRNVVTVLGKGQAVPRPKLTARAGQRNAGTSGKAPDTR